MDHFLTQIGPMVWPLSTLVIALLFRKDVGTALGRIGRVKYRDLELTFHDDLKQAEQLARSIPLPSPARAAVVLEAAKEEVKELGGRLIVSPSGASEEPAGHESASETPRGPRDSVEAAWDRLVRALGRAAQAEGDRRSSGPINPEFAARLLVGRGRIGPPEAMLIGLLKTLRDRASRADQPAPTADEARRFVELAHRVASGLEGGY